MHISKRSGVAIMLVTSLIGILTGMTITIVINNLENTCYNEYHDDEYVNKLIKDNIMLDRMNQELIETIGRN